LYDRFMRNPARIVANPRTLHGQQDAPHTAPHRASSWAMPLSFGPQSRLPRAAVRLTWHGDARPGLQRLPAPRMPPTPPHALTAFVPLSRPRCPPGVRLPGESRVANTWAAAAHPQAVILRPPPGRDCTLARLLCPGGRPGADLLAPGQQVLSQDTQTGQQEPTRGHGQRRCLYAGQHLGGRDAPHARHLTHPLHVLRPPQRGGGGASSRRAPSPDASAAEPSSRSWGANR
jgi:hypothetical protein